MKRVVLLLLLVCTWVGASNVAVVSMAVGDVYKAAVADGITNRQAYCDQHGYDFIFTDQLLDPSRPIAWSKVQLILQVMDDPQYEWIFWSDADSLITNMAIPVANMIDDDYDMIISWDDAWSTVSTGQFLIRNCEWSRQLLLNAYARTELINHGFWEQEAINRELRDKPELWNHVKLIPHRLINSFPYFRGIWKRGDFLVHFAGSRNPTELKN